LIAQPWTARAVFLKIHLWLGLAAAIFLVILGLTGSIMAFEGDIDHWLHPSLWYVDVHPQALPQQELIDRVERQFAPARVAAVQISRQRNLVEVMQMTDRSAIRTMAPCWAGQPGHLRSKGLSAKSIRSTCALRLTRAIGLPFQKWAS